MEKKNDDYTKRLGRATWDFLHVLAEGYNPQNKEKQIDMFSFINKLSDVYTCKKCQKGFKNYLHFNKPITCCNKHFINYIDRMHKNINDSIKK